MESASAFAPGNVSCIFVIKRTENPATSGSLGMGFTVNEGVVVKIKSLGGNEISSKISSINSKKSDKEIATSKTSLNNKNIRNNQLKKHILKKSLVYFNNKKTNFPAVNYVIQELARGPVEIKIRSSLPLGCGFGLSGASALASSYALAKLFSVKKSIKDLAFIAHMADAASGTGLGDVINQYYGGFLVKYEPSSRFKAIRLPIKDKSVYCKYFSSISTKKIISNAKLQNTINNAGMHALSKIKKSNNKKISLKDILHISKEFSLKSNLLKNKKVIALIKKIEKNNGNASMIMLGNSVFSDKHFEGSKKLMISEKAAHLL